MTGERIGLEGDRLGMKSASANADKLRKLKLSEPLRGITTRNAVVKRGPQVARTSKRPT
jgi:hypothetical protein